MEEGFTQGKKKIANHVDFYVLFRIIFLKKLNLFYFTRNGFSLFINKFYYLKIM